MAAYYIDISTPTVFVPCTFVSSRVAGKTLLVRTKDGASMVVEPDGSQSRWMPSTDPNFDSPYTQGDALSGFLVFCSDGGPNANPNRVPRGYRMVA